MIKNLKLRNLRKILLRRIFMSTKVLLREKDERKPAMIVHKQCKLHLANLKLTSNTSMILRQFTALVVFLNQARLLKIYLVKIMSKDLLRHFAISVGNHSAFAVSLRMNTKDMIFWQLNPHCKNKSKYFKFNLKLIFCPWKKNF